MLLVPRLTAGGHQIIATGAQVFPRRLNLVREKEHPTPDASSKGQPLPSVRRAAPLIRLTGIPATPRRPKARRATSSMRRLVPHSVPRRNSRLYSEASLEAGCRGRIPRPLFPPCTDPPCTARWYSRPSPPLLWPP